MYRKRHKAFTLSELLIALAILGVIATFTIPKVLQSQQNTSSKAITKEAAGSVSAAYQAYQQQVGTVPTTMTMLNLTQFLNYVAIDTVTQVDGNAQNAIYYQCSAGSIRCLKLHNGGMLYYNAAQFGGNMTTNAVWFSVDPDGVGQDPTVSNGPSKAVEFYLYYNGRITTCGQGLAATVSNSGLYGADPTYDPTWFNWN